MRYLALHFLLMCTLLSNLAHGQLRVFTGSEFYLEELVMQVAYGRVLPAYSNDMRDVIFTCGDGAIYFANGFTIFDQAFAVKNGQLYQGDRMFQSDILYTFAGGRIYAGNSTYTLDVLYTIENSTLYRGNHAFPTERLYYLQGTYRLEELFAVLVALELL